MCWNQIAVPVFKSPILSRKRLVPCGYCIACVEKKRAEWSFRLRMEEREAESSNFLTLTYNDKYLPRTPQGAPTFDKRHIQTFFKRVRKKNPRIKYYLSSEYGSSYSRSHYHAIVFNSSALDLLEEWRDPSNNEPLGFAQVDTVSDARIHYVTGYMTNKFSEIDLKTGLSLRQLAEGQMREFAMMSKGLGKIYLKYGEKMHKERMTDETMITGHPVKLGRYLTEKVFTPDELRYIKQVNAEQYQNADKKKVTHLELQARRAKKITIDRKLKLKQK